MRSCLLIFLVLAIAGCPPAKTGTGTSTPPPRSGADAGVAEEAPAHDAEPGPVPLDEDYPTMARRSAEMFEALADAMAATPIDCAALAGQVKAIIAEHRDVRVAAAAAVDRGNGRALDRALEAHADRIKDAAARMQPALTKCGNDAAFAESLTPFDVP